MDLGSVTESLFESELFGHRRGAFTGASSNRIGRLQAADGGSLFLDEIGNIPLHLQARLLTVLEQRQLTPVGANTPIPIDVRVIAATNVPREELTREQRFRQDLLFRLNTVEITLPPLRERREDIPALAAYYCDYYTRKYDKPQRPLAPEALAAICADNWPGNVRALRHAIERAIILAQGEQLRLEDFQLGPVAGTGAPPGGTAGHPPSPDGDLNLARLERAAVEQALKRHQYNISQAAKDLGLTRAALYRRMEKHDL